MRGAGDLRRAGHHPGLNLPGPGGPGEQREDQLLVVLADGREEIAGLQHAQVDQQRAHLAPARLGRLQGGLVLGRRNPAVAHQHGDHPIVGAGGGRVDRTAGLEVDGALDAPELTTSRPVVPALKSAPGAGAHRRLPGSRERLAPVAGPPGGGRHLGTQQIPQVVERVGRRKDGAAPQRGLSWAAPRPPGWAGDRPPFAGR